MVAPLRRLAPRSRAEGSTVAAGAHSAWRHLGLSASPDIPEGCGSGSSGQVLTPVLEVGDPYLGATAPFRAPGLPRWRHGVTKAVGRNLSGWRMCQSVLVAGFDAISQPTKRLWSWKRCARSPSHFRMSELQDPERVQAALVLPANGNYRVFQELLQLARTDWRDLLMGANLADIDWPEMLSQHLNT